MGGSGRGRRGGEIVKDVAPLFRLYKDGGIERLGELPPVPPSLDPETGVASKDVVISPQTGVFVRLFNPRSNYNHNNNIRTEEQEEDDNNYRNPKKMGVVMYFHGGGFCTKSTTFPEYHKFLNNLASQAQVLIVSVEYRRSPEHPLPAAYDDAWLALNWVASHAAAAAASTGGVVNRQEEDEQHDPWLLEQGDFGRVFLVGDSAGGNIAHQTALRFSRCPLDGLGTTFKFSGLALIHPFFWGERRIGDEVARLNAYPFPDIVDIIWPFTCPGSTQDHPWLNPASEDPARLSTLPCDRVLVFVADKDFLYDRGVSYKHLLDKSGWPGSVQLVESKSQNHVFHLFKPSSPAALHLLSTLVAFLNPTFLPTRLSSL